MPLPCAPRIHSGGVRSPRAERRFFYGSSGGFGKPQRLSLPVPWPRAPAQGEVGANAIVRAGSADLSLNHVVTFWPPAAAHGLSARSAMHRSPGLLLPAVRAAQALLRLIASSRPPTAVRPMVAGSGTQTVRITSSSMCVQATSLKVSHSPSGFGSMRIRPS